MDSAASPRFPLVRVVAFHNPAIAGDHRQIAFGDPDHLELRALRERYRLPDVVRGQQSEWEQLCALRAWVRQRWDHGWHDPPEPAGVLELLERAGRGEQFCCGHYSQVLVACCTALGFPARRVGLWMAGCERPRGWMRFNSGHVVAEVWSNEHGKWAVMDADLNGHFERGGVPLNALEIREAALAGEEGALRFVQGEPPMRVPDRQAWRILRRLGFPYPYSDLRRVGEEFIRGHGLPFYRYVRADRHSHMGGGHHGVPPGLEWEDEHTPPQLVDAAGPRGAERTSRREDLHPTLNQASASLGVLRQGEDGALRLPVSLRHSDPYFSHFEARFGPGRAERVGDGFDWLLRPGRNRLRVAPVSRLGRRGIPCGMTVEVRP